MKSQKSTLSPKHSRRQFIKTSGGALFYISATIAFPSLQSCNEGNIQETIPEKMDVSSSVGKEINVWVHIHENDMITIFNPSSEMGQGSMTALAVIISEELDIDWEKVHIEQSPADPEVYGAQGSWGGKSMITVGSRTVMSYYDGLRQAGAQARFVLLSNVADHWSVPIAELSTKPNLVIHKSSNRQIAYGEIASFLKPVESVPEIQPKQLKNPDDFRLIGKVGNRFDIPAKVNGSAQYAIDVQFPEMTYGVITRSPVHGSRPKLLNGEALRNMEGVLEIVMLDHGIGIIANSIELALKAKSQMKIDWSRGAKAENHNSVEAFEEYAKIASSSSNGEILENKGNINRALQSGNKTYESDFKNDYLHHAHMEPLNAVVSIASDKTSAEVWVGTQAPGSARSTVANLLGIEPAKVKMHRSYLGGGFGRRSNSDFLVEATNLAMASKRPVKLIWTREDDIQYGMYRPMSLQRMRASVDRSGNITGWQHIIVGPGGRLLATGSSTGYYTFPNQQIEVINVDHGIRTKHWRAVGHGANKFAIEAFVDEIASDQKFDPLEFRLQLMSDFPRAQKVLTTAANMGEWSLSPKEGRAKGLAFAERSGSLAACVCEISVNKDNGRIKVHNIWASLDAGVVVQPDNAIAQMEGALVMGMSSVLKESITIKNGKVLQSNYHDYPILGIDECPDKIDVKIIPSRAKPSGIGESGIPIIGGAIANAFARLTGKRIRHIPFTPKKVLAVLND